MWLGCHTHTGPDSLVTHTSSSSLADTMLTNHMCYGLFSRLWVQPPGLAAVREVPLPGKFPAKNKVPADNCAHTDGVPALITDPWRFRWHLTGEGLPAHPMCSAGESGCTPSNSNASTPASQPAVSPRVGGGPLPSAALPPRRLRASDSKKEGARRKQTQPHCSV
jgi:hypothetical protein